MSKTVCHKWKGFKETIKQKLLKLKEAPGYLSLEQQKRYPEDILEIVQTSPVNASWE